MKNYPQILAKVMREFWAITEDKHFAMVSALESRLASEFAPRGREVFFEGPDPDGDEYEDGTYFESNGAAVIPVYGILGKHLSGMEMECGGCSMDRLTSMLDVADASARIERIVLNISSPGGTVTGTPELADRIAQIGKPVIAFTDSECCSGALWLASQADRFYCTGSSSVGSVGVRMVLLDFSEALKNEGVKVNPIVSGKYKMAGASFKPLSDDEREMFQAESDQIFADFKAGVTAVRPVAEEFLQGQVFRGEMAARIGMVDGLVEDLDEVLGLDLDNDAAGYSGGG